VLASLFIDYPQVVFLDYIMSLFDPAATYRREAWRFRQAAKTAHVSLRDDYQELAALYEKLAEHIEEQAEQPLPTQMLN